MTDPNGSTPLGQPIESGEVPELRAALTRLRWQNQDLASRLEQAQAQIEAFRVRLERAGVTDDAPPLSDLLPGIPFSSLVDDAPWAVFLQSQGCFAYVNPAATLLFGAESPGQLLGRRIEDLVHPCDREEVRRRVQALCERRIPAPRREEVFLRLDGSEVPVEVSAVPIEFAGAPGAVVFVTDLTERRQAEAALRRSEERQRAVIASSPLPIVTLDPQGQVLTWNRAAEQTFGWSVAEVLGRRLPIVPDEHLGQFEGLLALLRSGESFSSLELTRRRRDGTPIEIALSTAPIRDGEGRVVAILSVMADITQRKRSEEELRRKHAMLVRTEAIARVGSWAWEVDSDRVTWSEELFRIFGMEPAEEAPPLAEHQDLYVPEDRERLLRAIDACVRDGIPYELEARIVRPDGHQRTCVIRGVAEEVQDGRAVRLAGSVHDITERKRVEDDLRASEEKFRRLFSQHSAVKLLIDPASGRIVDANQAAARFYGWPVETMRQMNVAQINTLSVEQIQAEMERARREGQVHFEFRHRKRDGSVADVELFSSRVVLDGKEYLHSIVHDVTQTRRLEAQLLQAQKLESVGRLAGGVAHDFNNMLGIILGYSEMALNMVPTTDPLFGDLQEIREAARRSADIARQLLTFASRQTIEPRILDLGETVEGMLKMLRRLLGENIELEWRCEEDLWPVLMDPSQVDQVLANLCVNARDAIREVGRITIEMRNVSFDEAFCELHVGFQAGDHVLLSVSDDGVGMDRQTLEHLFEPFFTTKPLGEGTGLGLATVYGIVKQNRGFIDVYSEPGQGSVFKIYLPRHEVGSAARIREAPSLPARGGRETILLVEDEKSLLRMTSMMLETLGYRVLAASSPGEALRLAGASASDIHLLITDVVMPEMNGRELAREMLALRPAIKSLFTSGYTANVIAHHGVLDEGVCFLQKPFSASDLADRVREALQGESFRGRGFCSSKEGLEQA